jgi:C1A family cysteine protease
MESSKISSSFKKLVVVGTVAAVCAFAGLFNNGHQSSSAGMSLFSNSNIEIEQAFIQYIAKYGKSYASKDEIPERFQIFSENYKLVQAHNANPNALFKMELNRFADMPVSQKSLKPHLEASTLAHNRTIIIGDNFNQTLTIPEELNWNLTGKLSPIFDQLQCNADWAITTVESLEAALAIKNNNTAAQNRISIQHLIDCDQSNSGCLGGWPARAWKFLAKNGMLAP